MPPAAIEPESSEMSNGLLNGTSLKTNGDIHDTKCSESSSQEANSVSLNQSWGWGGLYADLYRDLYAENITAKIMHVAQRYTGTNASDIPTFYPEIVPQSGDNEGQYKHRPVDFWTSGFFPGSIYLLLERSTRYPKSMGHQDTRLTLSQVRDELEVLGKRWSDPLRRMAHRTDTHDLGFMVMPHMRLRWELFHERDALENIKTAAVSLYSRFDARVGAIRSWDALLFLDNVQIRDKSSNFLVIIDSLCNLEMLYYAAAHTGYGYLAEAATTHAKTLKRTHLRKELSHKRPGYEGALYSTCHVVNFSPATGHIQEVRTAQGYSRDTTWSRGQGWAILGYAQSFAWTGDEELLDAACGLAEYFLLRLESAPAYVEILQSTGDGSASQKAGRYVPLWDFDAPVEDIQAPLRDVSAGVIAANGMLVLAQALTARGQHERAKRYLGSALRIIDDTLKFSLSQRKMRLQTGANGIASAVPCNEDEVMFESVLRNSTVSWHEHNLSASGDHGLVYADYYLIEFGNRLLQLGYGNI